MSTGIVIIIGDRRFAAELFDTPAGQAVAAVLPIAAELNEWGDEFYFEIPVEFPLDPTATMQVRAGDIGYWPPGRALAVFFGPTPKSSGPDPVPASAVHVVGKVRGDASSLGQAKGARSIRVVKT